jgi:regulator of protease activity HflC (stomatin/prohibitin superfamily)
MTGYDEERIAQLLRLLPAVPEGLVQAAQELPAARAEIVEIVARAEADAAFRARLVADLESALEAEGYPATPSVVASLRARLGAED